MAQLHKKFTSSQVRELIERYLNKEIESNYIRSILGIGKTRFFALLNKYRTNPDDFSIQYQRKSKTRTISKDIDKNILKELKFEQKLIKDKTVPLKSYNYSYIKDQIQKDHHQNVSLSTIINRAKKHGFYLRRPERKLHDREVLTNYAGELIQHDSSQHKWSPYAPIKWYLITSLDDFSRYMPFAKLKEKETSWAHIDAMEHIFLNYGLPYSFYVDSHSIFRFVQGRDSIWRKHYLQTDDADTQWKQVLNDCNVKTIYALSPQAKGKIERPYRWLQDRLVRTCARQNVTDIKHAQRILNYEVHQYNYKRIHSTTGEVPYYRFKKALKDNSLFRKFEIKPPFKSTKDIFCLRLDRTIDAYRKVSVNNLVFKVNGTPYHHVNLRIYPLNKSISEVRFWCDDKLIDVQRAKNNDLKVVHF